MNKLLSVGLLVVGIVFIVWGVQAMESFRSDLSRFFTDSPTDKAVWLLLGGVIMATVGLFGARRVPARA